MNDKGAERVDCRRTSGECLSSKRESVVKNVVTRRRYAGYSKRWCGVSG